MAKHRSSLGIFEAAMVFVAAAAALWIAAPIPGAKKAADEERAVHAVIGALADALEARMAAPRNLPPIPLDRLAREEPQAARVLEGFQPFGQAGVLGNRSYWVAVLLPGKEGVLAAPGEEDPAEAARGFCVVAWPREGSPEVLRELAALPEGVMWQHSDGLPQSRDPGRPPVPRVVFAVPGSSDPRVPDPPPDWAPAKRRRGG